MAGLFMDGNIKFFQQFHTLTLHAHTHKSRCYKLMMTNYAVHLYMPKQGMKVDLWHTLSWYICSAHSRNLRIL